MESDEQQIRDLVATWLCASKAGDVDTVLSLMTEDVVFLRPGCSPMNRAEFAEATQVPASSTPPEIEGTSVVLEIQVAGYWAFMISQLSICVTAPGNDQPVRRAGHTLTIFRKTEGTWLLARDANLLAPVQQSEDKIERNQIE